jgi:hypothetical protein
VLGNKIGLCDTAQEPLACGHKRKLFFLFLSPPNCRQGDKGQKKGEEAHLSTEECQAILSMATKAPIQA